MFPRALPEGKASFNRMLHSHLFCTATISPVAQYPQLALCNPLIPQEERENQRKNPSDSRKPGDEERVERRPEVRRSAHQLDLDRRVAAEGLDDRRHEERVALNGEVVETKLEVK